MSSKGKMILWTGLIGAFLINAGLIAALLQSNRFSMGALLPMIFLIVIMVRMAFWKPRQSCVDDAKKKTP